MSAVTELMWPRLYVSNWITSHYQKYNYIIRVHLLISWKIIIIRYKGIDQ